MLCPDVVLGLTDLLAGVLPPASRAAVESHVSSCAQCRAEWAATRLCAYACATHLPAAVVTALAWDLPPVDFDPRVAYRHLEDCAECAEDLALARACRAGGDTAASRRPAWTFGVRAAGMAAGLALALAAGALVARQRTAAVLDSERRAAAAAQSRLGAEADRWRREAFDLRSTVARLSVPRPNLPIAELLAGPLRAAPQPASTLAIGLEDPLAVLVFDGAGARAPLTALLSDEQGRVLWTAEGLRPSPLGAYALGVPAHLLPEGRLTLVARSASDGTRVRLSPFRVRRSGASRTGQRQSPSSWNPAQ